MGLRWELLVPLAVTAFLLLLARVEDPAVQADPVGIAAVAAELRPAFEATQHDPVTRLGLPLALELERIVSIRTAAILRDVSVDSITRHYNQHIITTGGKVRGIKLKYVLDLVDDLPPLPRGRAKRKMLMRKRRFGQGAKRSIAAAVMPEAP
jgi:hypothetical protein